MNNLDISEKQNTLCKIVLETCKILEFDDFDKVFFCGSCKKYNIQDLVLIVVDDNKVKDNRFYEEMSCQIGICGSAYIDIICPYGPYHPLNKHNTFYYIVITNIVFNNLFENYNSNRLNKSNDFWQVYKENLPGLDITNLMYKMCKLKAFL